MDLGSLIIYDNKGKIWYNSGDISGATKEHIVPNGLPYIITNYGELDNKIVLSIDISSTPHRVIIKDIDFKPSYMDLENKVLLLESEKVEGGIF